ncbi:DNA polymerase III subunit delta [Brevundimonas guildfordensis]|uniref:DNA-directed DNA polymerase n=1 Tax=Brevundimonas guildfordensis TaxID=2762241 RepID=A0ABR8R309_9CAUL|nr:DNA polymerase III subunit delta [Brevundimonas guildfordensis]MBD7942182.1 DNA polymerase III subunit delta [Brevundimonas guildfordensis]
MILSRRPDVDRFLKAPDAGVRAAVIHGKDRSGVTERALTLCKTITPDLNDPFNVTLLTEADIDGDPVRLEEALTALSMIGGRRLVRVRMGDAKGGVDKAVAAALSAHAEGAYNPDAMLVIEAGALGRESALRKAAEKAQGAVAIACYEDEVGDVARMTREALGVDKVGLTSDALDRFVARLPRERGLMRQEIERLILYIGPGAGRTIDVEELDAHLGVEPDASLSDAALQAFGGRPGPAQAGLRRALAEGESAVMAVRMASIHLGKLRRINVLQANGAGAKEAAKSAGVFWKQEAEMLRQARGWRLDLLDEVMDSVNTADVMTKTTGMPEALIAERLLLEIAARAKRMGL